MASASRVREVSSGPALRKVPSALGSQGSRDIPLTTNIGREIDNTYVSIRFYTYIHTYLLACIHIHTERGRERERERDLQLCTGLLKSINSCWVLWVQSALAGLPLPA